MLERIGNGGVVQLVRGPSVTQEIAGSSPAAPAYITRRALSWAKPTPARVAHAVFAIDE